MKYKEQIDIFKDYFKNGEKKREDFKLGVEFEHFVIDKDTLKTISYYGKSGVAETLKDLENLGYEALYEGEYILGLQKDKKHITTEPGSQLELSIDASLSIKELEEEYLDFLQDIIPILNKKNQAIIATGYHPETRIDEIKLLPKKRYDFMYDYFKTKGTHAHNMMKGTAALQVAIDYESQEDYIKKFKILNALTPVFYAMFENAYYFEGEKAPFHNMRSFIWENCDKDRSGVMPSSLDSDYNYGKYAEYILEGCPIFIYKDGREVSAKGKDIKELLDPYDFTKEEIEHYLTMFFPDVRTKKYIEIRMMDSVPYPLNFSAIALFKGLLYNEENLEKLLEFVKCITLKDVEEAKHRMMEEGLKAEFNGITLLEIGKFLVELSHKGLDGEEKRYLEPLKEMLDSGKSPYEITKSLEGKGKKESLNWCILNNLLEDKNE
ncbi:glutamate--cysteine ligase [Tissierella creatinophila]|uniref:Glutamate--cysteine ligase n=1 Tax=Tissierella creatinophila DSM 6911 TaxID=1123403 RepID=A0A1U7M2I3_TISCR|nr:glutamate-cysteine ligase family protein [Tissierella creatinophila]OLS01522.1 glutamate--cysteine ligase GshA [Tissierella creatinophila DSM 6911]